MKRMIRKFYLFGFIVAVAVAVGLFLEFNYYNKVLIAETQQLTILSRDLAGSEISSNLLRKGQIITDAASYLSLEHEEEEQLAYLKKLMKDNPSFSSIYFGRPDNVMINGSDWVAPKNFDLRTRPWYLKAVAEEKLILTEAFVNASKDKLIITIATPVYDSNKKFLGVAAGDVSINGIVSIVKDKRIGENGYSFLIDGKGNILAHPSYTYDLNSKLKNINEVSPEINEQVIQDKPGIKEISIGGIDGYLAYQPIKNTDWSIGSFIPLDEHIKREIQFLIMFMITLISTLLVFLIFLALQKKHFISPILRLEKDVQKINIEKNLDYRIPVEEKDAFASLRRFINEVLDKTQDFFMQVVRHEEELRGTNEKLEASLQQLTAAEEELRNQYNQQIESEEKLRKSEERNIAILNAMPDLLFVINSEERFIDCQASDERLLLIPQKAFIGKTIWEVMPNNLAKIYSEKLRSTLNSEIVHSFEYQLPMPEGIQLFELRMAKNNEKEVLAISRNVTLQKMTQKALEEEKELLKTTLLSVGDGVIATDQNGNITTFNQMAEQLTGWTEKEAIVKPFEEVFHIIHEDTREKWDNPVQKALDTREIVEMVNNVLLVTKEGTDRMISSSTATIKDQKGNIRGAVLVFRDITAARKNQKRIEYLSYHDQLTGLYNRRFFEEELKRIDVKRNYPLTIVMSDVNGLKLVNDAFGHALGDQLLIKVAEVIGKGLRADDIVARLGGDEFVVLLPKTEAVQAEQIIKRIQIISQEEKVAGIELSISFGWETKRHEDEKIYEILKKSEDYMYKKKLFDSPSMRGKTIGAIMHTLNEKNKREEQHSHRVAELCRSIGKALNLSEGKIQELHKVGLLHDIGKIAVEENILNKNGKLSDDEWKEVKRHPEIGYRILSSANEMAEMAEYVLSHHERIDGRGYPRGLKEKEIPLQARIIAIADAYDAMTNARTYGSALTAEAAIEEIEKNAGRHFDPDIVMVFVEKVWGKLLL